jgi:hypothetical protein
MYLVIFQHDFTACQKASDLNEEFDYPSNYMLFVDTIEEANEITKEYIEANVDVGEEEWGPHTQIFSVNHEGEIRAKVKRTLNTSFYPNEE